MSLTLAQAQGYILHILHIVLLCKSTTLSSTKVDEDRARGQSGESLSSCTVLSTGHAFFKSHTAGMNKKIHYNGMGESKHTVVSCDSHVTSMCHRCYLYELNVTQ